MSIKKLPQHVINKLKAWEIVERPMAVVKELVENSLDAWATSLKVTIEKWGKKLIKIQDNGEWISKDDLLLTIERYATSKIAQMEDLEHIMSYGFRGEALASISEVSIFRIQTKTKDSPIWYELYRSGSHFQIKEIPFATEHGTIVIVEDLFHMIPVREKFLKSDTTERWYIRKLLHEYAMLHFEKQWTIIKDGKNNLTLQPATSVWERLLWLTKPSWSENLKEVAYKDEQLNLYGLVWDASLHFPTWQYVHIFVNERPVEDKLIKKALMQAYQRQIVPWSYPFACLFIDIDPSLVDVNVHPRKMEVKFLDPWSMFTRVKESVQSAIGATKVNYAAFTKTPVQSGWLTRQELTWLKDIWSFVKAWKNQTGTGWLTSMFDVSDFSTDSDRPQLLLDGDPIQIIGQLRSSYIVAQWVEDVYYIDQHAVAERIAFEKMKNQWKEEWFTQEVLLQPLSIQPPKDVDVDVLLPLVQTLGFDISWLSESTLVVYAVPRVFVNHQMDIELISQFIRPTAQSFHDAWKELSDDVQYEFFALMLDEIAWMKACKAAIKAWQSLNRLEMEQLLRDANTHISGMFVCQHGRPSVVRVRKSEVEKLFERL